MAQTYYFPARLTPAEIKLDQKLVRDSIAGHRRVIDMGEVYQPRKEAQTVIEYNAMMKRTTYFNIVGATLNALEGKIFRKDTIVSLPQGWPEDRKATLKGETYSYLAQLGVRELLAVGQIMFLVLPNEDPAQPTAVVVYETESIEEVKTNLRGDVVRVCVKDGSLEENQRAEYYLAEDGTWWWRTLDITGAKPIEMASGQLVYAGHGTTDTFPGLFVNPNDFSSDLVGAPMASLAHTTMALYLQWTQLIQTLHFAASPQWVLYGFKTQDKTPSQVGPGTIWHGDQGDKAECLTYTGPALQDQRSTIDFIIQQAAAQGAGMLTPKSMSPTAARTVELSLRADAAIAVRVTVQMSEAIERILKMQATFESKPLDGIRCAINRDLIEASIEPQMLDALTKAWMAGFISHETGLDVARRNELLDGRSNEQELALIETEGLGMLQPETLQ